MLEFALATEKEIRTELATRLRKQRLAKGVSLTLLAKRAGVGRATLQRLETTGDCTFANFVHVVQALGLVQELQGLFALKTLSIAQMEQQAEQAKRVRAPRKTTVKAD
nr:helix-turn-helix transcriptional regulator [uncultured Noviherbaspirillum sp.]